MNGLKINNMRKTKKYLRNTDFTPLIVIGAMVIGVLITGLQPII